jgi:YcxB-like protein
MIEIRYRYHVEDLEELSREVNKRFPRGRRLKRLYIVLGIAIVLLPFLASGSLQPERDLWWTFPIGLLLICSGWLPSKAALGKHYRRAIFDYDYTATISESVIIIKSPTVRTELQWAAFSGYYSTENLFALAYENVTYLFPRRAFSPVQWQEFSQMVQRNVKRRTSAQ